MSQLKIFYNGGASELDVEHPVKLQQMYKSKGSEVYSYILIPKDNVEVSTASATIPSMGAAARGFAFPEETTGIFDIVIEGDSFTNISSDADGKLYNLNGQQVATPSKGVYVKRNKKVVIK